MKVKREQSLDEWTDRRERDLGRLTTAIENLALDTANGGAGDTAEIERLRVMTSKDVDAGVRSQIASAPDTSILPLASHRATDRALLDRMRREIERKRGEALLTPHDAKAVRAGRMTVGQAALKQAGAESVKEYLAMCDEHDRRRRGVA